MDTNEGARPDSDKPDAKSGNTPADLTAGDSNTDTAGGESDSAEKLLEALRKEREARKAAEKKANTVRTDADRLADLESEVERLRIEKLTNKAIDDTIAAIGKDGYRVDRDDVLAMLEGVTLTADNMQDLIAKRVDRMKRSPRVQTPENATPSFFAGDGYRDAPHSERLRNPYQGFRKK